MNFSSLPYNSRDAEDSKLFFRRLKDGDPGAWRHIYDCYYKHLCYFAYNVIQDELEAADIVLETFCKLWRLIDRFDSDNNLRAFLYVTVRNDCFDYLRHRQHVLAARKEILLNSETSEWPYERFSYDTAPVRELVSNCIDQLPEQTKRIFKMYYFDELNTTQIAFILGMTKQAVRNNKTRAINMLKQMLLNRPPE